MDNTVEELKKMFKRLKQIVLVAVALLVIALLALSSVYTVSEQERAVVTQFGRAIKEEGAGLKFKIPIIQRVRKVPTKTQDMSLGYINTNDPNNLNNRGSSGEFDATADNALNKSAAEMESVPSESFMITKDINFVSIDFYIEWRISEPIKYLYNSEYPVEILRNILQSAARTVVSEYNVDDVLTTKKSEIQAKMKESVTQKLDFQDLGIVVTNITIQDAEPPTEEVISAFKDVETAKQEKVTAVNTATKEYNEQIPGARAFADGLIKGAEGQKQARTNEAEGQVSRFNNIFSEYIVNKDINRTRLYLEAMEEILPNIKVYIESSGSDVLKVLNLNEQASEAVKNSAASTTKTEGSAQ